MHRPALTITRRPLTPAEHAAHRKARDSGCGVLALLLLMFAGAGVGFAAYNASTHGAALASTLLWIIAALMVLGGGATVVGLLVEQLQGRGHAPPPDAEEVTLGFVAGITFDHNAPTSPQPGAPRPAESQEDDLSDDITPSHIFLLADGALALLPHFALPSIAGQEPKPGAVRHVPAQLALVITDERTLIVAARWSEGVPVAPLLHRAPDSVQITASGALLLADSTMIPPRLLRELRALAKLPAATDELDPAGDDPPPPDADAFDSPADPAAD